MVLSGCTAETVVQNSSVTVASGQAFFSLNDKTSYGAADANSAILQAVSSSFNRYDSEPKLVQDTSFGTYRLLSNNPLTVKYTIADGVTWSDGVPVDASDLLLAWAANSGALNTKDFDDSGYVDPDTGQYAKPFPADIVYFDGQTSQGLQYVTTTPVIGDEQRSLTLTYDRYFPDWPLVLQVGLPAHVVAEHALKLAPDAVQGKQGKPNDAESRAAATKAKAELVKAIQKDDTTELSAIANFWNSGFNFEAMPKDLSLLVSTGPYTITGFSGAKQLTLSANPNYRGDHRPVVETIVVKFIADPLTQLSALKDGSANVILPRPGEDVSQALAAMPDVTVQRGVDGAFEHLDLQLENSKSGFFSDTRVREAFLRVVPRQEILEEIISPVDDGAAVRSSQLFMPGEPGYSDSIAANGSSVFSRVDVAGAKRLLAEAGVTDPTVCILFDPANPKRVKEFQLIRDSAALAGFRITDCSSPDWVNLLGTPGSYDASLFAWKVTNLSIAGEQAIFATGGRNNLNFFTSAKVDDLFGQLSVAPDDAARIDIKRQLDAELFASAYGLPLYQDPAVVAVDGTVSGVELAPLSPGILWNVWQWKPVTPTN